MSEGEVSRVPVLRCPILIEDIVVRINSGVGGEFEKNIFYWYIKKRVLPSHLKRVFNRSEHEDIEQEVMIHLLSNLHKYETGRVKFITWVWRVVSNRVKTISERLARFHTKNVTFSRCPCGEDEQFPFENVEDEISLASEGLLEAIHDFIEDNPLDEKIIKSLLGNPDDMILKPKLSFSETCRETGASAHHVKKVFEERIKPFFVGNYELEDF